MVQIGEQDVLACADPAGDCLADVASQQQRSGCSELGDSCAPGALRSPPPRLG
jgi:hypothetical protein